MSVVPHKVCTYPVRDLLMFEQVLPDMCYATPKGIVDNWCFMPDIWWYTFMVNLYSLRSISSPEIPQIRYNVLYSDTQ